MKRAIVFLFFFSLGVLAKSTISLPEKLKSDFVAIKMQKILTKDESQRFKKKILKLGEKSIAGLSFVMRNKKYPIESRWQATFLLGQVAGKSSSKFISKFSSHPDWMQRLASLKTLSYLGHLEPSIYKKFLLDKSMIVRFETLEIIERHKMQILAPQVWNMMLDKKNYIINKSKTTRSKIIKKAIRVLGQLDYQVVKKPFLNMIKSPKYNDLFVELDYSLSKILKKRSPEGEVAKKFFWKNVEL